MLIYLKHIFCQVELNMLEVVMSTVY